MIGGLTTSRIRHVMAHLFMEEVSLHPRPWRNQFKVEGPLKIISRTVSRCHHYEAGRPFLLFFIQDFCWSQLAISSISDLSSILKAFVDEAGFGHI